MKKALFLFMTVIVFFAALSFNCLGQNTDPFWSLAGNNNATTTSILGTTNSVPLRFLTKNTLRMTIDTFGFVGIGSSHPVSTLDVRGTEFLSGLLKFGTGSNGIQFANPTSTSNKPMMLMFTSGTQNLSRMVIAHSTTYSNWGLQYNDTMDRFNFLANGITNMSVELASGNINTNGALSVAGNSTISGSVNIGSSSTINGNLSVGTPFVNSTGVINATTSVSGGTGLKPSPSGIYANGGFNKMSIIIQNNDYPANYWAMWPGPTYALLLYNNGNLRGIFDPSTGAYSPISDSRLKTNVRPMESVLDKISQLKPSSFQFKDTKDEQFYDGFLAQDVKKIFPNLVTHVEEMNKKELYTLNYSGFGVIAIKAIQEQQDQIKEQKSINDQQNETINNLQNQLQKQQLLIEQMKIVLDKLAPGQFQNITMVTLEQNSPNPARTATSIGYTIPGNNSSAQLQLTDNLGRIVKSIQLNSSGRINVDVSLLASGTYTYSLVIDGKIVETKKLVKTSD